ncbi:MAG: uroporphyrinogen decarboxylase/cobalamine-independent methonine synthase family protein [Thermoleophilia bacterium]
MNNADDIKGDGLPMAAALAIGSMPHTDPGLAVDLMLEYKAEVPSWPQLPRLDFRENMYAQFMECMPAAVIDESERRVFFDTERAPEQMAEFYEHFLAEEVDFCGLGVDHARGFHEFVGRQMPSRARFIKGQVTGPVSFGLTVPDQDGKPVLYHQDLFDAIVKALALKGRWQVERFAAVSSLQPVIFFDEPYLTQMGSALISLPPEQITASLNECYRAVAPGSLTGTHVCGGTDWGLLAATEVDILHFDAAAHSREFLLYEKEIAGFMERGGMLAWGIVPNDDTVPGLGSIALAHAVIRGAEKVAAFGSTGLGAEDVLARSFISEACGTGSLNPILAEKCFALTQSVSDVLQGQLC